MGAVVKRHWPGVMAMGLILLLAGGWFVHTHLAGVSPSRAATAGAPAARAALTSDPVVYGRVQQLRQALGLTQRDLAACGCGAQQTEALLTMLVEWCQSNHLLWEQFQQERMQAQYQMAELSRRINVGPRDAAVLAQFPQRQQQLLAAETRHRELIQSLVPAVEARLNANQAALWAAGRSNGWASDRYRYAPGLTKEQVRSLQEARKGPLGMGTLEAAEAGVLTFQQKEAMAAAQANVAAKIVEVSTVEEELLPLPQELRRPESVLPVPQQ